MKRMMITVAGASMLALSGAVFAESFELSDTQLDGVTAGATAVFNFFTTAGGDFGTTSGANVVTIADTGPGGFNPVVPGLDYAAVFLNAGSIANSVFGVAASQTSGAIGSSLP
ncbi:hypothetical protein CKO42_05810 [Lamprobacter modestohalophilus]|uniref:PEP-CTERM sorting domain-containing protein n=1 Tax=Lamprobacter modestohalophilus TaxID=1064514 RepID=A0A9X0W6W3_9GAMM|nr:hypothetical protein [Lamprobacter modestohalophilus]MCF7977691.1 hypothetical protein [Chromatiaceae bacterium]MBK1617977.1 hypothetical protein [Lamprobacter modestohalophilus]MCF7994169.1 hypothetical protein [Chromatiaceae bacterium]MCF8003771.1 hypothetical protein [Chromatiaceae bacterium]MCF8016562.1 hypothetical protein [Chromatiaceae bacterium]